MAETVKTNRAEDQHEMTTNTLYRRIVKYTGSDVSLDKCWVVDYCLVEPTNTVDKRMIATIIVRKYVRPYELYGAHTQRKIGGAVEIVDWLAGLDLDRKFYMDNTHGAYVHGTWPDTIFVSSDDLKPASAAESAAVLKRYRELLEQQHKNIDLLKAIIERIGDI